MEAANTTTTPGRFVEQYFKARVSEWHTSPSGALELVFPVDAALCDKPLQDLSAAVTATFPKVHSVDYWFSAAQGKQHLKFIVLLEPHSGAKQQPTTRKSSLAAIVTTTFLVTAACVAYGFLWYAGNFTTPF